MPFHRINVATAAHDLDHPIDQPEDSQTQRHQEPYKRSIPARGDSGQEDEDDQQGAVDVGQPPTAGGAIWLGRANIFKGEHDLPPSSLHRLFGEPIPKRL